MAPHTRSGNSRMTPAPRQQKIGTQHKRVNRRTSPPKLPKKDSTLTQIGYIQSSRSVSREVIQLSSDNGSEFEEVQPKKKRKINTGTTGKKKTSASKEKARNPKRNTLTQMWDGHQRVVLEIMDSEDGEDEQDLMESCIRSPELAPSLKRSSQNPAIGYAGGINDDVDSEVDSKPIKRARFALSSDAETETTRPMTADSTSHLMLKTPRTTRTEVPSSVTPESIHLSTHSTSLKHDYRRSPLKERSANSNCLKSPNPVIQVMTGIDRTKLGLNADMLKPLDDCVQHTKMWTTDLSMTPKKKVSPRPRRFLRTTTIQDSEDDGDSEYHASPVRSKSRCIPFPELATNPHDTIKQALFSSNESCSDQLERGNLIEKLVEDNDLQDGPACPTSQWRRTGVVQDSEQSYEDNMVDECHLISSSPIVRKSSVDPCGEKETTAPHVGEDAPSVDSNFDGGAIMTPQDDATITPRLESPSAQTFLSTFKAAVDDDQEDEDDEDYNGYDHDGPEYISTQYPQTYDPAAAALERDGARFGKTDTQIAAEERDSEGNASNFNEDVEEDGDEQLEETEKVPSSPPFVLRVPSSPERVSTSRGPLNKSDDHPGDMDDSGYVSLLSANEIIDTVPSSQPGELRESSTGQCKARDEVSLSLPSLALSEAISWTQFQDDSRSQAPRPSQVSTVCETQSQPSRPNSSHGDEGPSFRNSPRKSNSAGACTLSSSPFPLPPGYTKRNETQASFADFSLPPPPPLLSSMRQSSGTSGF